jgi:hypothetical protein
MIRIKVKPMAVNTSLKISKGAPHFLLASLLTSTATCQTSSLQSPFPWIPTPCLPDLLLKLSTSLSHSS